jgi:hypothetical protein
MAEVITNSATLPKWLYAFLVARATGRVTYPDNAPHLL